MVEIQEINKVSSEVNHDTARHITNMEIGQAIRQGDVYVKKVEEIPSEYNIPTMEMQIAKGDTKGSRHILEDTKSLRVMKKSSPSPLDGPAIVSDDEIHLTHPEHPNFILPAGKYLSFYQQDFAREEISAVRD